MWKTINSAGLPRGLESTSTWTAAVSFTTTRINIKWPNINHLENI